MKDFIHLHVHSEYSLLDGYASTKAIAERAVELGMDSIALTDHGVMYGAMEFYTAARKAGIKPIIGVEAYMAPGAHYERSAHNGKSYYHALLLARNATGYRNLVKLTTRAHLDGFYYKPRIDHDLLAQYKEGLIATSTCLAGEVPQALLQGQKDRAREIAAWHRDLFGPDHYYLELQLHEDVPQLEGINDELVRMGQELGIPLVATNDTHFVRREDIETHRLILAMGYNMTLNELCSNKRNMMDESYHIMSGEEMWQRFKRYGTAPLENSRRIADMCNLELDFGRVELPAFDIPAGHDAASYLRLVCEEGLMRRTHGAPSDEYRQRLDYELDVINQTGFPDYMLIVWDYVKFARSRGIPCLPRGSAGASLVLYCLGITDVDPLENKLLFERFLSPERLEMPDIDVDFADSRRHEVLEYITNKYGRENTAQIITYGTLGAKAALRDVGRVLDVPLTEVDRVAKLIPPLPVGITIKQALERVPELRQIYDSDARLREVIERAQHIEGRIRNVGTHACGLVISRSPLENVVPLQRTTKDENAVMAAYEGATLANIGLLKMDILGLTNLSIVANALDYIAQTTGKRIELSDIPLDDAATFASLSRGETTNVFQFESAGMTRYMKELKPTRVQDLYAMVALYRPGPLEQIPVYIHNKNNPHDITYLHPILKPILEDTYGVIVYQEQIMQLLQAIAGYTLGQAYIVLKAIGKKKRDLMAQEEPRFKEGCRKNGLTQEQADRLWDLIQPFAGYSFNRPHSTLYGLLSYQTAYLKVNYPTEYMAAVLSAAAGTTEDVAKGVAETLRLGVAVLPANVNRSHLGFTIEELPAATRQGNIIHQRGIRFGLSAIKNVGVGPVSEIIKAREADGPFHSLEDFCARVDRHALNKRVVESLIKSGAMDDLPGTRRQKLAILDQALAAGIDVQKAHEAGQVSMFAMLGGDTTVASTSVSAIPMPTITESAADKKEELSWEKELLGMYISEHPVVQALRGLNRGDTLSLNAITEEHVGHTYTFIGMLTGVRRIATKKGDAMLVAELEDLERKIEIVVFPRTLEQYGDLLQEEAVLQVTAKVDNRRDTLQLVVERCAPIDTRTTLAADEQDDVQPAPGTGSSAATTREAPIPPARVRRKGPHYAEDSPSAPHQKHINGKEQSPAGVPDRQSAIASPSGEPPAPPEPVVAPPPTPATDAIPVVKARTRVNLDNGGAGKKDDRLGGNGDHAPPQPPVRSLHLHLPRSEDFDADVQLMQDTDSLLRTSQGHDEVLLHVPNSVGTVVLRPRYRVQLSTVLIAQLREILGEQRVEVV